MVQIRVGLTEDVKVSLREWKRGSEGEWGGGNGEETVGRRYWEEMVVGHLC